MASLWIWLFGVLGALIGGALVALLGFGLFVFVKDLWIKRGIPRDKVKLSEYIKENPERFENTASPLPSKLNKEKEIQENDRREAAKYREFEKLRRAELKTRASGKGQPDTSSPGNEQLPGQRVLQNEPSPSSPGVKSGDSSTRRRIKLDG